jgi:hypothetical protein
MLSLIAVFLLSQYQPQDQSPAGRPPAPEENPQPPMKLPPEDKACGDKCLRAYEKNRAAAIEKCKPLEQNGEACIREHRLEDGLLDCVESCRPSPLWPKLVLGALAILGALVWFVWEGNVTTANKMRVLLCAALSVCTLLGAAGAQAQDKSFEGARSFAAGRNPAVAVGDFNGDGGRDLAMAGIRGDAVTVLLGNADGTSPISSSFATGSVPVSVAMGDFNGDGLSDLVVVNINSNNVSVLLGNGDGSFQEAQTFGAGSHPYSAIPLRWATSMAMDPPTWPQ